MTLPGVLVCGEALIDLLPADTTTVPPSGPVPFVAHPSGSPANTAVALARLGVPVQLAARLSGDAFGGILRRHLESNRVDLRHSVSAREPSTVAVVGLDDHGDAQYSFYTEGTSDWQWTPVELPPRPDPSVAIVHAGSLGLALPPGGKVVEEFLGRCGGSCLVSLDPNVRPDLIPDLGRYTGDLERWVGLADIVKVSAADLRAVYPDTTPEAVAERWHRAGRALTVLTRGAEGARVWFDASVIDVPTRPVRLVDTIAAGDTFTAGLLQGLLSAGLTTDLSALTVSDVRAAAARGCAAAAAACERAGPDPPYAAQLL